MKPGRFEVTLKLLLWRDQRLLVLRDATTGLADLPGGRMGEGERFGPWTEALAREVLEELGADVRCEVAAQPAWVFGHTITATQQPAIGMLFHGELLRGEPVLSDEHDAMTWWSPGGPLPWSFPPTMAQALTAALQTGAGTDARATNLRATLASTSRACTSSESEK